ncbi:hypothetical protein BDW59DRAFT_151945 [Aspergillus cavernicola]|uniref:HECT-type E3 ubiquitin transferase n=1 Tax=Aspergillus cavernicola TaxID=176166 RepID=A0ABR4HSM1_9EURO
MTRLRGPSVSSYEGSRGGIDRPQCHRSKLPPGAPDVIAQNTVDVSNPAQVLLWYRDERRRQFNLLVRRYKNQLLYGCQDPNCQTPSCASYRRRVTEGPYRRYTELSARTLACYLASFNNAETGLCRNSPRVHSELSSQDPHHRSKGRTRAPSVPSPTHDRSNSITLPERSRRTGLSMDHRANGITGSRHLADDVVQPSSPVRGPQTQPVTLPEPSNASAQRMKDPKSFTQNLFDTLSLRMIEWLPLRRSPGSFDFDQGPTYHREPPRSPNSDTCQAHIDSDKDQPRYKQRRYQADGSVASNPHTPSSRNTGGQTTTVELKLPNQQFKRLSHTEAELRRTNSKSSLEEKSIPELKPARKLPVSAHANTNGDEFVNVPSPPALKHRSQKHRGRPIDANSTRLREQAKKDRRVSWDGSKFLNDVQSSHQQDTNTGVNDELFSKDLPSFDHPRRRHSPHLAQDSTTIQSLSHLNQEIIDGLRQMLILCDEEAEQWRDELALMETSGSFEDSEWRFATSRQRTVFPFVTQSVFYALGSTRQLLRSFREEKTRPEEHSDNLKLNLQQLQPSLHKLFSICPKDIIFHSLWNALEALFVPPRELSASGRLSRRSSYNSNPTTPVSAPIIIRRASDAFNHQYVTDANAADVATVVLFALAGSLPEIDPSTWSCMALMRSTGNVAMSAVMDMFRLKDAQLVVEATDVLEHELALRLVDRLVRALTARLTFHEISKTRYGHAQESKRNSNVLDSVVETLIQHQSLVTATVSDANSSLPSPSAPAIITEWLRTLFIKTWDGNPEIPRSSSEGGVVQILSVLYKERSRLGLTTEDFHTPFLPERLDPLEMPVQWMARVPSNKTLHLLSYSFLFPPSSLVIYFRALNYSAMSRYYEAAMTTTRHVTQTAFGAIEIQDDVGLLARMKTSMTTYLVLVIRRDNILTDALNQLWRRERRELMRPLKIQMGMDEGEEGLDHGGVQQEFFRLLMGEALESSYGMFTMDDRNRISWFQPCSWEPLYKYELLGLLMSLAVYNGLTLPVNFPTAFYRKLLGLRVKHLEHVRDGWPELTKGLDELLRWSEGDVGDIFLRTYEFGFEAFGRVETVDMQKVDKDAPWPLSSTSLPSGARSVRYSPSWSDVRRYTDQANLSPPSSMAAETADSHDEAIKSVAASVPLPSPTPPAEEAALVTNENRGQFVKDYIFWLTDKSIRPQFEAFAQGFYTCLDRPSLSIFTPEALKTVVEGIQEIDMAQLERHARYEGGFGPSHRVIREFWSIAHGLSADKRAQLLEFVTASDRVPVNGISSIMFVIQKNGVGDARLPTSLTCFGRLLLPEYSSKSVLEEKLHKALENAQGFGVA